MEQIRTANVFQMATIFKLKVKTKSDNQNSIRNDLLGTNFKSQGTKGQTIENEIFKMDDPAILAL